MPVPGEPVPLPRYEAPGARTAELRIGPVRVGVLRARRCLAAKGVALDHINRLRLLRVVVPNDVFEPRMLGQCVSGKQTGHHSRLDAPRIES